MHNKYKNGQVHGQSSSPTHKNRHRLNKIASGTPAAEWDRYLPVPQLSFGVAAVIVFITAVACFANSYDGHFAFDDSEAILKNDDLLPETPITDLFYHDFWGSRLASNISHKSYRPLTVLTFRLNHYLAGGLHPRGFHIANIILHGLVSILFLVTFSVLFSGSIPGVSGTSTFLAPRASVLSALLFAVHPVHSECVAGVVGRADLMCAMMFLLSFLSYVKSCHTDSTDGVWSAPTSFSLPWILLSMILCAISVLFKEQGLTVLGICSAYDILVECRIDLLSVVGLSKDSSLRLSSPSRSPSKHPHHNHDHSQSSWVKSLALRQLIITLTGVVLLVVRWRIMGSAPPTFQVVDNPHSFVNNTILRVLNYNYIYSLNVWLMVNPWWLCFDWSMGCVPVIASFTDPRLLVALLFWLCLSLMVYACLSLPPTLERRTLSIALALVIVPFLPASNLFFRVGFVIAERILYLSSSGICIIFVLGVNHLCRSNHLNRHVTQLFLYTILLLYICRSVQRSYEWRSEKTLFEAGANICPLNAKVQYNIAKIYADAGETDYAIGKYRLAIELNPEYDQAMNNLGNILKERNQLVEAEQLLARATDIRPEFAAAWMNLGIIQASLGKTAESEVSYRKALQYRKKYADCYYNMGNLFLDQGRHVDALAAWRNATLLKPTHISAWNNFLILLDNLGRIADLEVAAKEALTYLSEESSIFYNIANAFGKAGHYQESEKYFLRAVQLEPKNPGYHSNLGVLYHRWGKLEEAEKSYLTALQLDPSAPQTIEHLKMLRKKLNKVG